MDNITIKLARLKLFAFTTR